MISGATLCARVRAMQQRPSRGAFNGGAVPPGADAAAAAAAAASSPLREEANVSAAAACLRDARRAIDAFATVADLQVSVIVCTVTLYANHAHSLTRSP